MSSRPRILMTNMAAVALAKATAAVAGLLTIMVLTRHLGPEDFGYYRTALTFAAFASVLADLGIYFVTLREMSRPDVDTPRVVGNAMFLRLASSAAVLLVASFIGFLLPYEPVVKRGLFLAALMYTCIQGSEFLVAVFQRAQRQGGYAVAEICGVIVTLAGVWWLSRLGAGVLAMLTAALGGAAVTLLLSWQLARRLVPFRPRFEPALWRQYFLAGLPIAGSHIFGMAILRGDTVMLSLIKPAHDVGLYGVPTKMFELTTTLPYVFAGLMMPMLTAAGGIAGRGEFHRLLSHGLNAVVVFGVGTIVALSVFAPQILGLVAGREFASGAPALVILSFAAALMALSLMMRFALIAIDRPRSVLYADAAACVLAFGAYLLLIPKFSFIGAAAGTVLAEAGVLAGMLWGFRRAGERLPRWNGAGRTVLAGAIAAAVMWALARAALPWILALVIGGAIYAGALAVTGAVPRELILKVMRKPRSSEA
jgi:O-antigen/teichoic acid export membrane protein